MTEPLRRQNVIELLQRLGSDRDEVVLDAAREVHAQIAAADLTWEDLLVPEAASDVENDAEHRDRGHATLEPPAADDDVEYQVLEDEVPVSPAETAETDADTLALIDALLARSAISEDLREELETYRTAIGEGEFEEADRRYLRALHDRLSKAR